MTEIKQIKKRDGRIVDFDKTRITNAIFAAAQAVGGEDRALAEKLTEDVIQRVEKAIAPRAIPTVEEVQDAVEKTLIKHGHAKTAKAYILYRDQRTRAREFKSLVKDIDVIENYINEEDWRVKENSNMTFSLQGLDYHISSKLISNYWLEKIYPPEIRNAHEQGDFHIHDLGTLGAYCFDEKTMILTENGWKLFKDVKDGEKVATKNLETGELEFQVPYAKQIYQYSGEMYSFEGRSVSLLVTPEHRLLVRRKGKKNWEFVNPPEFKYGMEFDKRLSWKGNNVLSFKMPEIPGGNRKKILDIFKMADFVEFLGWYISEGSTYEASKGDYIVSIAQSLKRYRNEILALLKRMNLKANNQSEFNIHLHSKDLFYYLKPLGNSSKKYIPDNIKQLNSGLIKKLLTTLFKGDGSLTKNEELRRYYTRSRQLAEDVCECLLKIGLCGTISQRKDNKMYVVNVESNHLTPIYRNKVMKKKYNGKVYDFSVKNGTLVVMRDGKIVISGNCVGWDLLDVLLYGFGGVSGKIETKPPKHLRTALGQVVNFFYTLQGESAGAQAMSNFDTYLAPFIRYDNLDYKGVKQAIQEFIFNMNVPTRVGFQTPFSNITLDIVVPEHMKNEPVIIGGKQMKDTYGEFQEEMKMFDKAFAEIMMEGDAKGRPFTFPIPTICITKDFDWNNTNEMIWKMTAKYGIPYFSNFVNSDMKPDDVRSMCCRLRIDNRELKKRGGGLFGANPLTGSLGVVTINLPRIGYNSKTEDEFFKHLDHLMVLAKESLEIKRKDIERFTELGLYPYSKFYLKKIKDSQGYYWKNHFSTIGLIGMNEALINFMGKTIAEPEGREFALKVLDFMRKRMQDFQQETGQIYNLEATPAEGTTYRLALKDKRMYPNIVVANEEQYKNGAAPFYTNSTQLPVWHTDDIFEALELQDEIQTKYTGGVVLHGFLGESMPSIEATKNLVKTIAENFRLPYYTITPTFSICPNHGYITGKHEICPKCDESGEKTECEVYSRIVGYIRPVKQWNNGKKAEFEVRKTFNGTANHPEKYTKAQ